MLSGGSLASACSSRRNYLQYQMFILVVFCMAGAVLGVYETAHHNNHQNHKPGGGGSDSSSSSSSSMNSSLTGPSPRHVSWAEAAFNFIQGLDCEQVFFTTERECRNLKGLSKSFMNIYLAGPSTVGRFAAVLPDGGLARAGVHDGYITLDPYPRANFGHLVLVFHVTMYLQEQACTRERGIYLSGE